MQPDRQTARGTVIRVWAGRILSGVVVLLLAFDAAGKFAKPVQVVEAFVRLGLPMRLSVAIGTLLSVCTAIYAIPHTSVLGAVLLTGYLGGAVAIQMRAGSPVFETIFPVILGVLAWGGLFLRDGRLLALVLPRSSRKS